MTNRAGDIYRHKKFLFEKESVVGLIDNKKLIESFVRYLWQTAPDTSIDRKRLKLTMNEKKISGFD